MKKKEEIEYEEKRIEELTTTDQELIERAIGAARRSYSPYSRFHVGASLLLQGGDIATGNNQENVAYPSGLCAERTALFAASSSHPEAVFDTLVIVGIDSKGDFAAALPCGACRQVMAEYENRQQKDMRVLVFFSNEKIWVFNSVKSLLPFGFAM